MIYKLPSKPTKQLKHRVKYFPHIKVHGEGWSWQFRPITSEAEVGGSHVQSPPELQNELEVSLRNSLSLSQNLKIQKGFGMLLTKYIKALNLILGII